MSKKRNMAIAMAGAMVASATPAFATQADVQTNFVVDVADQAKLVNKVGELLKVKYTSKYDATSKATAESTESVYDIKVAGTSVESETDFENKIKAAFVGKTVVDITIEDKGHAVVGEETVNYTVSKYDLTALTAALTALKGDTTLTTLVGSENVKENNGKIEITLPNEEVIELGVGSEMLDFEKPLDKDGNVVEDITTEDGKKSVVGFDTVKEEIEAMDTPYTVQLTKTAIQEVEVSELFDGLYLTEKGEELVKFANESTSTHTVEVKKVNTTSATADGGEETKLTSLEVVVAKRGQRTRATEVVEGQEAIVTINGEEEELEALYNVLGADALGNGQVAVKLAGEGRFETAVEVSKQLRAEGTTTNAVVLTSAYSLVDGLAAGPLAAQLNTSILLTGKDAAPEVTMNEIMEVLNLEETKVNELKNKTVYVIGGEGVISEAVVDQLKALKVTVERLAGDDRHETSLAVANKLVELKEDATTEAFVVGANGEADAMSISAYAAQETTPIIVSGFNSTVNEDAVEFMEDKNLTIIGGDAAVSKELQAELDEANDTNTVDRLEGKTRFETNAAVINEYYRGADKTVENIFVAADGYLAGKDKLVDALTAAPLAAKKNAPIVLATEELTEKQTEALELVKKTNSIDNVFQVGGGIVKDVILNVMSIFGK